MSARVEKQVWDAERERPTHSRPVPSRLRDVDPDPYHTDRHIAGPGRAPLAEYGRASMPSHAAAPAGPASHFRDDREPMADPPRRSHPVGLDAYDRSDRAPPMMEARRGSFGSHDARVPPPAAYERPGLPDRGYERAGYPSAVAHRETSHDRVFGGPDAQRAAPRTYTHHAAAPEASRPMPSGYGSYDAPAMYSRGENENISNLTSGVGRSSFDRDLEYAALNAKVSDVEKRMVLAAKTRPW